MAKPRTNIKNWIKARISSLMEECRHVAPLYSAEMDRPLTLRERLRVRLHLLTCDACINYISNLNFMREVFRAQDRKFDDGSLRETLSPGARDRIRKAIGEGS